MLQLPIISNCNGCGACCMEQESPPGYVYILSQWAIGKTRLDTGDTRDAIRLQRMPQELRAGLRKYIKRLLSGWKRPDFVCIWFDREKRQCAHYDWRPQICRDFEVGCLPCHNWRTIYPPAGVTVEVREARA